MQSIIPMLYFIDIVTNIPASDSRSNNLSNHFLGALRNLSVRCYYFDKNFYTNKAFTTNEGSKMNIIVKNIIGYVF